MSKLFISYAHADREVVTQVSQELQAAGHEVWIDTYGIQGGTLWSSEIAKAINNCDVLVLFLSPKSVRSDYVRREVDIAFAEKRKILPVMLENVEIPMELDYQLAGIQYIDYQAPDWKSRFFAALGNEPVRKPLKDTGKLRNPYSSLPVLEPIERLLILSNREKELKRGVDQLNEHRLLVVTGLPGIGKSTFARALLEFRPAGSPPSFWYNFERQRSTGNSLSVLLDYISSYLDICLDAEVRQEVMSFHGPSGGKPSAHDVDMLISFLNQEIPIWLVFDNLETVLSRDTNEFLDENLELLFESLKTSTHNAKIIITNPFVPIMHDGEPYLENGTSALALEGLDDNFSIAFLRAYGLQNLSDRELKPIVREINGHPFILNHIARYIQAVGISSALENFHGGLEEVSERFGDTLRQRLSAQEFNALRSLIILNREIPLAGLCQIAQVRPSVIVRLREKGLLQTNDTGKFWLHNIVRSSLKTTESEQLRQAHARAMNYYRRQEVPLSPKTIDEYASVLEWHHHAVEAGDVISAYSALYATDLKDQLMKWNEYDLLVKLCEGTLTAVYRVEANTSQIEVNLSNIERINIYHTLGTAYFLLSNPTKSIGHLKSAINLLPEQEEQLRIQLLIELSETYNANQDFKTAIDLFQQIMILLAKVNNEALQAKFLHLRGIVHRDSGDVEAAKTDLEDAVKLYDRLNDYTHLGNATIDLGNVYYYQNQFEEAEANYRRALLFFDSQRDMRGVIIARHNIADILLQQEKYESALDEIRPAIELARKRKLTTMELGARFILVEAQIALARLDEAQQELGEIRELLKPHSSPCLSGQELLLLAFSYSKRNQPESAMNSFVAGLDMLSNSGCEYELARGYLLFAAFMRDQGESKQALEALSKAKNLFIQLNNQLGVQAVERILTGNMNQ